MNKFNWKERYRHWIEWGTEDYFVTLLDLHEALADTETKPVVLSFLEVPQWTKEECQRVILVLSKIERKDYNKINLKFIPDQALGRIKDGLKATRGIENMVRGAWLHATGNGDEYLGNTN